MTPPPDGTPWWGWLIAVVLVALVSALSAYFVNRGTKRDVASIKDQVQNTHTTNLRVDVDEVKAQATLAAESAHRTERFVADLAESIRATEHSADRRYKLTNEAIQEIQTDLQTHLDAVPQIVETAFAQHAADCPARTPKEGIDG